ncbi:uncharacterized protein TRAVEDRAFT_45632 [Trametes versicolor FP-101664 SS1]|uniref:uncharacterized protein n=1 Tax=Trametes versicolor (strain FP-101664) TaxID=717944 RepID=UPI00046233D6|nr:uncharacterized protein TRAVEDRAFT_45632 [Trametes versicolor FP-101664 SS1]EIW60382.1 hypothetical protein TRAVEDRAFT_45632 [Trametes versicolor FP-101664 SS1]
MATYNDPYAHGQYPQQYQDAPFNPYEVQQQQHAQRPYDQGGYSDPSDEYAASARAKESASGLRNGYGHGEDAVPVPMGEKTSSNMRQWRYEHQGKMWTKGSRARCFGRFFCCTIMIFLFLLISIVLSLALWLRPPNIIVGQPTPDLSTFAIDVNTESLSLGMPVNVSINNPNYFPVDITYLDAVVLYPINNTQIGSGHKGKVELKQFEQTNFTFPVTVAYNATSDPNGAVILDLAKHCGLVGSTATDVSLTVNVKVALKIFDIPISHTITNQVSFACPLSSVGTELEDLLKALGLSDIASLL